MTDDSEIYHYGILRRSGRYPWGSGGPEYGGSHSFLGYAEQLRKGGMSEVQVAEAFGINTTQLRAARAIAKNEVHAANVAQAVRLQGKAMSNVAIGQRMNLRESSVRSLLKDADNRKEDILTTTSNLLKERTDKSGALDIGSGTENHLGISATKLATSVAMLREQGYEVRNIQVAQLGTRNKTTVKVLVPPGSPKFIEPSKIATVASYSEDGGAHQIGIRPPTNVSSKRIGVNYAENGGADADGVIYVRPGVPELALGSSRYAQVRIAVDGTHYLKGMAMYKDDLPDGVDLVFNTNKNNTGNKLDAMKPQKDETNPFGSSIRQRDYTDSRGNKRLSPMNIVNEEGSWRDWSRTLSSQVLSKQSTELARRQLGFALAQRKDDLDEIMSLTNAVVKKKLLTAYADSADYAAVHLKAASLPRQGNYVILPFRSLKEHEVYAPNFRNGEKVALIRHPHGGTFEIPELTVNNKNFEARASLGPRGSKIGHAPDAIGIHPNVAKRLSGADFDGDTVLVIPNKRGDLKTSPPLSGLKNFDPQSHYAPYDGMRTIDGGTYHAATKKVVYGSKGPSGRAKQQQMGDVSNLITDMTIKGASHEEIAAAVRHSMVVIDAEKHALNFRQSYIDNGIASLKEKYQGRSETTGRLKGASTIISRAGSRVYVPERKLRTARAGGSIDPATGKKVYAPTGRQVPDRKGGVKEYLVPSKRLAEANNARALSSGMPIENIYADHSNALKALANRARKASLTAGTQRYSPTAAKTYAAEVANLNHQLNLALKNRPLERRAQLIANVKLAARREANPHMDDEDLKKAGFQELAAARDLVGARKNQIQISDRQWEAIQAGAISGNKLNDILTHADIDQIRKRATPRAATVMTPSKLAIAEARLAAGYTQAEIADSLGIPVSTLNTALHR